MPVIPNMRGREALARIPQFPLSAIFGNAFSPALGNGLRITYGHETHCRTNSVRSVKPSTLPTRSTGMRGDKVWSPFHIARALLPPRWHRDGYTFSSYGFSRPALFSAVVVSRLNNSIGVKADTNPCHFLSLSDLSQEQESTGRKHAKCLIQTMIMSEGQIQ